MWQKITSYLVFALHYISRVGPMPQQPMLNPLPELLEKGDFITVKLWKDISVKGYLESEASRQCNVVGIKRFKSNGRSQHEYLVAVLQCQSRTTRYVRIERNVQSVDKSGAPILSQKQQSDANSTLTIPERESMPMDEFSGDWTSFISPVEGSSPEDPQPPSDLNRRGSISASISKTGQAQDIVSYWEPPSRLTISPERLLEEFTLNTPIPLAHLAILASVVHEKETLYNLFKHQCYWYADVIAGVIAGVIHKQDRNNMPLSSVPQARCYDLKSGKFNMIPILSVRPRVVEAIENIYVAEYGKLAALVFTHLFYDTRTLLIF